MNDVLTRPRKSIRERVRLGMQFLDTLDPNWRETIKKNSMTETYAPKGKVAPPAKTKALDEFADRDGVLSRYYDTTADKALRKAQISREEAEDFGFYFKEANPHDRDAIYQEYERLSAEWNLVIFGPGVEFANRG